MMIFFKITIFVNYNANDELVSICDGKKKKKLDEHVLEDKSNDFGWKIPCKIKTFKADE